MAKYYTINDEWKNYEEIKECPTETEHDRMLDEKTCEGGKEHRWLLLPKWNEAVREGGKQYIYCLRCGEMGHL